MTMALELRDVREPGDSLREVLAGFAAFLVENIERLPDDEEVRIHDIRVSTKKIGSLLRLADHLVAPEQMKAMKEQLRRIRGAFSGSRDEAVLRKRLEEILPEADPSQTIAELPPSEAEPESPGNALALARELAGQIATIEFSRLRRKKLTALAARCYGKARKAMKACQKDRNDEDMHEWRKRVKDVSYHTVALGGVEQMKSRTEAIDRLAENLGEYHDFALLGQRVTTAEAVAAVAHRKHEVGEACFEAAHTLLKRKPRAYARKLAKWTKDLE